MALTQSGEEREMSDKDKVDKAAGLRSVCRLVMRSMRFCCIAVLFRTMRVAYLADRVRTLLSGRAGSGAPAELPAGLGA